MKSEIIQTTIKEIDDDDLEMYCNNFRKYGWTAEQVENLKKDRFMEREGKLSDGMRLRETVRVVSHLKSAFDILPKGF